MRIFHDAGHGGANVGAVVAGVIEKHLTLSLSRDCEYFLSHWPFVEQRQSRKNDESLDYHARGDIAEAWGAHLVLCHHADSSPDPSISGMRCYYRDRDSMGLAVAEQIMRSAPDPLRHEGWGPVATRSDDWTRRAHAVMANYRSLPCVLIEWGFLSNAHDRAVLLDLLYRPEIGASVLAGAARFASMRTRAVHNEGGA